MAGAADLAADGERPATGQAAEKAAVIGNASGSDHGGGDGVTADIGDSRITGAAYSLRNRGLIAYMILSLAGAPMARNRTRSRRIPAWRTPRAAETGRG